MTKNLNQPRLKLRIYVDFGFFDKVLSITLKRQSWHIKLSGIGTSNEVERITSLLLDKSSFRQSFG